jgi:probable rRNA maturation factor
MLNLDATIALNDPAWIREIKNIHDHVEKVVQVTLTQMQAFLPEAMRAQEGEPIGLAIASTDAAEMQELNFRFRGKNAPTNVLSFPADMEAPQPEEQEMVLGDVILAYGVVASEAEAQGKLFTHHMTHMVVHGLLHLLGFDHMTEEQAVIMEQHERVILARFHIPDPYAAVGAFMDDTRIYAG